MADIRNSCQSCFQECISFLRCFRKGSLWKCWQFPNLVYRRLSAPNHKSQIASREEKSVHNHHRKKIFWRTFLASKKNFPGRWWIQKPYKNQENHIHHRNLSSVGPIFLCKEKICTGAGGVWFLFPALVPKRKNFPQIAVSGGSIRTFKSRDL